MRITMRSQKSLFPLAILTDMKHLRARTDRLFKSEPIDDRGRDVFEFEGNDIDRLSELFERCFIRIRPGKLPIRNLASRTVRRGFIGVHAVTHSSGGNSKHSAELAAAKHTNGRSGTNRMPHMNNKTALSFVICHLSSSRF